MNTGTLSLDAEALYAQLSRGLAPLMQPNTRLVGIASGGVWLAERLHAELGHEGACGIISSSMHRDDFSHRGMATSVQTRLPFEVNGAHVLLLDDVLYTGRTVRAAINVLFDYGRPACIKLAALGRLTANIAHEIRNPLSAINHAAELLREVEPLSDLQKSPA